MSCYFLKQKNWITFERNGKFPISARVILLGRGLRCPGHYTEWFAPLPAPTFPVHGDPGNRISLASPGRISELTGTFSCAGRIMVL